MQFGHYNEFLENIDKKEYVKIDEKLLKKYFKEDKD